MEINGIDYGSIIILVIHIFHLLEYSALSADYPLSEKRRLHFGLVQRLDARIQEHRIFGQLLRGTIEKQSHGQSDKQRCLNNPLFSSVSLFTPADKESAELH